MTFPEKVSILLKTDMAPEQLLSEEELASYDRLLISPAAQRYYDLSQRKPRETALILMLLDNSLREFQLSEEVHEMEKAALQKQIDHYQLICYSSSEDDQYLD